MRRRGIAVGNGRTEDFAEQNRLLRARGVGKKADEITSITCGRHIGKIPRIVMRSRETRSFHPLAAAHNVTRFALGRLAFPAGRRESLALLGELRFHRPFGKLAATRRKLPAGGGGRAPLPTGKLTARRRRRRLPPLLVFGTAGVVAWAVFG